MSPLVDITCAQARALEAALGGGYCVAAGMRFSEPTIVQPCTSARASPTAAMTRADVIAAALTHFLVLILIPLLLRGLLFSRAGSKRKSNKKVSY